MLFRIETVKEKQKIRTELVFDKKSRKKYIMFDMHCYFGCLAN